MNELIEILEKKYNIFISQYNINKSTQDKINNQIEELINSFDKIEIFCEEDINDICTMLDSDISSRFKNAGRYFKILNKYPNQPQIMSAKKVIEETKVALKKRLEDNNKNVYDSVEESLNKVENIKYYINMLKENTEDSYIESTDLYCITEFLNDEDITDTIIDFYNTILINNNSKKVIKESKPIDYNIYDSFINKVKQINKSMSPEQIKSDKKILRLLKTILEKDYNVHYEIENIKEIIDILNQYITNEEEKEIIKRIKFLIHLHNVEVDLTDEQIEFVTILKDYYEDRVLSSCISDTASKNTELLSYLEDDYKFENVSLLLKVFNSMEISKVDQLKIISVIIKNNSNKKYNKKIDCSKGIIELFNEYNLSVEYLYEENIDNLNANLENVSEVLTHLINIDYDFVKDLSEDNYQIDILIDILMYSSKEIINKLVKLCNQEDIDLISLLNYSPYVLISSSIKKVGSGEFDKFVNNIEFCNSNDISVKAIEKFILEDTNNLSNRYSILTNLYQLDIKGNEKILENDSIINIMDRFIENHRLGYKLIKTDLVPILEKYKNFYLCILIYPKILSYDEELDKVIINELILEQVSKKFQKEYDDKKIFTKKTKYWNEKMDFFVSLFKYDKDDMLLIPENYNYIDESLFENMYIEKLENPKNKIKKNDLVYNLDGCYISRIKVLRVCTYLKDVLPKYNQIFNYDAIKFALRFEKCLDRDRIFDREFESKVEHFDTLKIENKTKKKKKK